MGTSSLGMSNASLLTVLGATLLALQCTALLTVLGASSLVVLGSSLMTVLVIGFMLLTAGVGSTLPTEGAAFTAVSGGLFGRAGASGAEKVEAPSLLRTNCGREHAKSWRSPKW